VVKGYDLALSIDDDDLCADCRHLAYNPGEQSVCRLIDARGLAGWPCIFDDDSELVADCNLYDTCKPGENLAYLKGDK